MWKSCRYHPDQTLQNFCINKACSMPLCPKCIHSHLCDPQPHKLVSLDQLITDTNQYLNVCLKGFQVQKDALEGELSSEAVMKGYAELIQRYRKEAVEDINQYYRQLNEELFANVQKACSSQLNSFRSQFEQIEAEFKNYLKEINEQKNVISALITINFKNQQQRAESLFQAYRSTRQTFKHSLPILQPAPNGKLEIISRLAPYKQLKQRQNIENTEFLVRSRMQKGLGGIQRIACLEDRLHSLRSRCLP